MTTNVQVIEDALSLIGVVAEGQTVSAEQGELGLRVLNQVLELWAVDGVELGYFAQTSTTNTIPIPAWAERGVTARLAKALVAHYAGAELSRDLQDDAQNGVDAIRRIVHYQTREPLDTSHLGLGEGGRRFIDITG